MAFGFFFALTKIVNQLLESTSQKTCISIMIISIALIHNWFIIFVYYVYITSEHISFKFFMQFYNLNCKMSFARCLNSYLTQVILDVIII